MQARMTDSTGRFHSRKAARSVTYLFSTVNDIYRCYNLVVFGSRNLQRKISREAVYHEMGNRGGT
jgi:hypothetical protein